MLNYEAETDISNVKHRQEFGLENESGEHKSFLKKIGLLKGALISQNYLEKEKASARKGSDGMMTSGSSSSGDEKSHTKMPKLKIKRNKPNIDQIENLDKTVLDQYLKS